MTLLAQCREALENLKKGENCFCLYPSGGTIHNHQCAKALDILELLTPAALKADEEIREQRNRFKKALERIKVMESSIPKLDKNNYAHGAKIADEALSQKP